MLREIATILFNAYNVNKTESVFVLDETGRQASCREARFKAKNDYLIYKFDQSIRRDGNVITHLFPFYDNGKANAMCDYVIFYKKSDSRLFAVICNLKSKNKSNNPDQLKAGEIFSQFIFDTAKRLYPETFASIKLEKVNVLFSTIRLYSNNSNSHNIINLLSNDEVKEPFIFENRCN
jgi:hypothetical protein